MDIKTILDKYGIKPDPQKDQFFLTDEEIIEKTVKVADINEDDTVLEIGAGLGNLTTELAKKAKRVISFEIDRAFEPILSQLPKNVETHFENAWEYVQLHGKWRKTKEYNKVVANIPYSFAEQLLHNFTFLMYDKIVLLVPKKFLGSVKRHGIFSSFFEPKLILEVDRTKFFPVPRTDSVLIDLVKLPDPLKNRDLALFLRQYVYQHEDQKVRNSLMEGIITYKWLALEETMTKNEARKMVKDSGIDLNLLETQPGDKIYEEISRVKWMVD
ncbi:MAG: rRNA adenine N-6-methyltransferase family protein [Candidatus Shapirobacteria bacterium]|jgi:16S rRNA (adenine1518-N6/adenine1519-N6)-dimethyltransferase